MSFVAHGVRSIFSNPPKPYTFSFQRFSFRLRPFERFYWSAIRADKALLYRNGFSLIQTRIHLPKEKNSVEIPFANDAILGSLWISPTSKEVDICSVKTSKANKEIDVNCTTIAQLLKANIKGVVEIQINSEIFTGRINCVQMDEKKTQQQPGLLILENEKGQIALPLHLITSIRMPSNPSPELFAPDSYKEDSQQFRLITENVFSLSHLEINYRLNFKNSSDGMANMQYISPSLGWIPNYRLELSVVPKNILYSNCSSKEPQIVNGLLSLKATVMNDGNDLYCDELTITDGMAQMNPFPSEGIGSELASMISADPLVSDQPLQTFVRPMASSDDRNSMTDSSVSKAFGKSVVPCNVFNRFSKISIRHKERISLPIFEELSLSKISLVSHCRIYSNPSIGSSISSSFPSKNCPVRQAIRFSNTTETAWPAGSLLLMEVNQSPQQEDTKTNRNMNGGSLFGKLSFPFTPSGQSALIDLPTMEFKELTVTSVEHIEPLGNAESVTNSGGSEKHYRISTEITVSSQCARSVIMVVSLHCYGRPIPKQSSASSGDETIILLPEEQDQYANSAHQVEWTLTLEATSRKTITYSYLCSRRN